MANLSYIKANRLSAEVSNSRRTVVLVGGVLLVGIAIATGLYFRSLAFALAFGAISIIVLLGLTFSIGQTKQAGAVGEDNALAILEQLPDSYVIFNQMEVPNPESRNGFTELDLVVLGPNGLFAVEIKNNNGHVVGSEEDSQWVVQKTGRKGGAYTSNMGNPIKQTKRQIWALKTYLQSKKLSPWITGAVLFPNPMTTLEIRGQTSVPLFQGNAILSFIQGSKADQNKKLDSSTLLNALIELSEQSPTQ